jgi:hypothetical protein
VKRLFFVIPVVIFLGLAVLLYVGLFQGPPQELPSPLVGKPGPDIALPRSTSKAQFHPSELAQGQAGHRQFLCLMVRALPARAFDADGIGANAKA